MEPGKNLIPSLLPEGVFFVSLHGTSLGLVTSLPGTFDTTPNEEYGLLVTDRARTEEVEEIRTLMEHRDLMEGHS